MRRTLFFWMEKLKITPAERRTLSVLMVLLVSTALANAALNPVPAFGDSDYGELDEEFRRRTEQNRRKHEERLARYVLPERRAATRMDTTSSPEQKRADREFSDAPGKVNVNTAGASELQKLPGIGPAYADRIIAYRLENGPFTAFEELMNIRGIGKKRLEKLLPFIQLRETEKPN